MITLSSFYFSGVVLMFMISLINIFSISWRTLKQNQVIISLVLLLLCIPFITAIGTANTIYMQILLCIFVWMPVIILLSSVSSKSIMNTFSYFTITGFSLLSTYYAYTILKENPYGLYDSLPQQTHLTKINNSKLYVDSITNYIIENTQHELKKCGFKSNDFLVSLTDLPGLTYAVHARSPSCAWYFGIFKGSDKFTQFCLSLSKEIKSPYILLSSFHGQTPYFTESQLGAYFSNFLTNYQLCGEVKNIPIEGGACCKVSVNDIKIYKPRV
ncbi:MAG: hypothetical protein K0R49_662 [Burkholderiales bacterium]|nr:hypothetical protein [Burkholderiales bacterium]